MALDYLLAEARKARLSDDYPTALKLCNAYLSANPNDPAGESLLGLCEIESGRPEGAARLESAAARKPDDPQITLNLSILREAQGDLREAVRLANIAASRSSKSFESWAQLGKLLGKAEKFDEAFAALSEARKLRPDHSGVMMLYAVAALETENLEDCAQTLTLLESAAPSKELRRLRVHLERKRGDWPALQDAAAELLKEEPANEEARTALAHALSQRGYYDKAAEVYAPFAAGRRPQARHLAAMGRYMLGARRLEEAKSYFERALERDARESEAIFGLARLSHFEGRKADALQFSRRALAIDPASADAFGLLAETAGDEVTAAEFLSLEQALELTNLRPEQRVTLLFAKGDVHHARREIDAAFDAWSAANDLKRSQHARAGASYDRGAEEKRMDALAALFTGSEAPLAPAPAENDAMTPIFIVGMPRSGTTLLETALAAHAEIAGAGEVPALPFILDDCREWAARDGWRGGRLPDAKIEEWRSLYDEQCRRFSPRRARYVTDKQPTNFMAIGLIERLFPASPVIYIRRNPVETSFSIFRRNFSRQWPFATSLDDIAHFYAEQSRLIDYWAAVYASRVCVVQYETLVRNFRDELRRIVDFCGLAWDEACVNYQERERSVMTFSAGQVREGPSEKHLDSTSPYASRLEGLVRSLEKFGVDPATGAWRHQT